MTVNSPTLDRKRRPDPGRRRVATAFVPGARELECRAMPSTLGVSAVVAPLVPPPAPGTVSIEVTTSQPPSDFAGLGPAWGGLASGPTRDPHASTVGPASTPPGKLVERVSMAEADVRVAGKLTPEFAFADASRGVVAVKVGRIGSDDAAAAAGWIEGAEQATPKVGHIGAVEILSAADGIKAASSVALADVNGDGIPDLLVANTGGNNVLVYFGLPGGGIGPELRGGAGFAVGDQPSGITIGDVNGDGIPDLLVANKGSNDVSVMLGRGGGASWTLDAGVTLPAGVAPLRTALQDVTNDGRADLFIANSGSNNVIMYRGAGDGTFNTAEPTIYNVGIMPTELFVGRFDRRPGLDLVTVNSGSDDLTFVAGITTGAPLTTTVTSGGSQPDAAFAVDVNRDGILDLVVANGGDGRVALLQGGGNGLQLAGVISRADLPTPTAVAPGPSTPGGVDFFAAGAGQDVATLLHFDLGPASAFLGVPMALSSGQGESESDLIAQLLSFGDARLELIAVLWDGGRSHREDPEFEGREPSLTMVPYAKTEGQDEDGEEVAPTSASAGPPAPPASPPDDPASYIRFVLGLDRALGEPPGLIEAVAARDQGDPADDPSPPPNAARGARAVDHPDLEAVDQAADEVLRSLRADSSAPASAGLDPARPDRPLGAPREGVDEAEAAPLDGGMATVPVVASSVLLACRLILKASPPRRATIRRWGWKRLAAQGHPKAPGGAEAPPLR